ncbi:integral membrane protein [Stagonosporopsis vannaccii]|nr:integral membrane protein [Stagonosporopsis vannaccii]
MASTAQIQELFTLGKIVFVLSITLVIWAWLAVGLRLWVRFRITKSPGWDDAAMVATLLLFTTYCAFILTITMRSSRGMLFTKEDRYLSLVFVQLSEVFYILTTTLLKISLGLFFLRVLTKRWQTVIFHTILGVSAAYGLFYTFTTLFVCGDPAKLADSLAGSRKCLPAGFILATGYIYGVINIIADWTFVLIPIVILVDSDIDRRSKISVSIVMGLGAIGSVSSILRMVYLKGLLFSRGAGLNPNAVKATIWATAEPGTGIVAASIALLRPLLRKIASDTQQRVSLYKSRKASLPDSTIKSSMTKSFHTSKSFKTRDSDGDSIIALTTIETNKTYVNGSENGDMEAAMNDKWNRESTYGGGKEEDPWSPTVTMGKASVQKVINVQMVNGRGSPVPQPQGRRYI